MNIARAVALVDEVTDPFTGIVNHPEQLNAKRNASQVGRAI